MIQNPKYYPGFLEKDFLLDKGFKLNTHKIVNFRVNPGFNIYLYDLNYSTLYYCSPGSNGFCADLGIHNSTYKKALPERIPYLGVFIISNSFEPLAKPANLALDKIKEWLNYNRKLHYDK